MGLETSDKIMSITEAIKLIPDGAQVALGGWVINRCVIALVHEMIRQKKRNLIVTQGVGAMDADLLVGAGCVKRYIYAGGSLEPSIGPLSRINEAYVNKEVEIEEYSGLAICFKYLAGALGIPYIPIKSVLGSDILTMLSKSADIRKENCPFTGENLLLLRALNPDFALIHAQRVDTEGNAQISGALWDTREMARAARKVIISAEEIVNPECTRQDPERTTIPGYRVAAIVHSPYGAFPTALYKCYDYDHAHMIMYSEAARRKDSFEDYLNEYILGVKNHWGYLEKIGIEKLEKIRADPLLGY
ncbi:CoA transferase subunit A [[Eubacterium] cellulosolvens]